VKVPLFKKMLWANDSLAFTIVRADETTVVHEEELLEGQAQDDRKSRARSCIS
jgi:hypothetical protein